jgi:glycosyltransferase involved in cell wall biosynthesis
MTSNDSYRILFVNPVGGLGGAERALLDFLASLRQAAPSLELHLLLFARGPLEEEARRRGARVELLLLPAELLTLGDSGLLQDRSWGRRLQLLAALGRATLKLRTFVGELEARIEAIGPDLVHTNGIKAHLLTALAKRGAWPLVWHIHDFLSERPVSRLAAKVLCGRANAGIAISEAVAEDLRRTLPRLPVTIVPNGIDTEEFSEAPGDVRALDALSGLPPAPAGTLRVGLVATYARWKGQDAFLDAAARVCRELPTEPIRFYVVGGPIYATDASQFTTDELRQKIQDLGLESTTGLVPFQRDLPRVFRSLDIVVHASTRPEPFGRSIVEAMACGRAVIVAAAGGARELVEDQQTGLTHSPGDVARLAECIQQLVASPELRTRLGGQARATAVCRFSRDRLGPSLLGLYRRLGVPKDQSPARPLVPEDE